MKLISLNTWGGRGGLQNFLAFIERHKDADIFCLQEVWAGGEHMVGQIAGGGPLVGVHPRLLQSIQEVLPEHRVFFHPHFYDFYGLATFVKKSIAVIEDGEVFVYKERGYISPEEMGDHSRNIQYVTFNTPHGARTVINFHGLWRKGANKNDIEDRLLQSDNIARFLQTLSTPFVLCGDFNLLPHSQSMQKLERIGLRNLVKEFGITSTRTHFYTKGTRFADYALVSEGIEVEHFAVLPDEVSDHNPLLLSFK